MKKVVILIFMIMIFSNLLFADSGHFPFTSLGFSDGTRTNSFYSINPYQRQATGSTNQADYDITYSDAVDIFSNFQFDTSNKKVFLVYTVDGTEPRKNNGTSLECSFEKYAHPDRWFYGQIPVQSAGTIVKYVIYISDGDLASAWGRITDDGYTTSWSEGDSYFGYGVSANASTTYHSVYFTDAFDNWRSNESTTDGNSTYYYTWDETYLYIGVNATDLDFTKTDPDRLNIGVDKDPGGTNGDASTGFAGYDFSTNNDGYHKLDYILQISDEFSTKMKLFDGVDGSFDGGTDKTYTINIQQKFIQVSIPWSDINNKPASSWGIILWTSNKWDNYVMSSFPTSNPTGDASTALVVEDYYLFNNASSGVTPNNDGSDQSLPVTLSAFIAKAVKGNVVLEWETSAEIENQGFVISRQSTVGSRDGFETRPEIIASFATVDALKGQGTTTETTKYAYTDKSVEPGKTYVYTLADVDYAGNETVLEKVEVKVEAEGAMLTEGYALNTAYPNPFNPSVTLSYQIPVMETVTFLISDLTGRTIWSAQRAHTSAGTHELTWDGNDLKGAPAPSGLYILKMNAGEFRQAMKLTLVR